MNKETFYFSHDYNTRNDPKIKKMLSKHSLLGYGIFWAIIEDLYQNANALPTDFESIAYDLRVDKNVVESIVNDFDLFIVKNKQFSSYSVQRRLDERFLKSIKARESANNRWNKMRTHSDNKPNELPAESDSNAIKERKVKERKINIINHDELLSDVLNDDLKLKLTQLFNTSKWKKKKPETLRLTIEKSKSYEVPFMIDLIEKAIIGEYQGLFFTNTAADYQKYLSLKGPKKAKIENGAEDFAN